MQIAMVAAGFDADQADELRRAMAAWHRKGKLTLYQDQLKAGMSKNGYEDSFIERICRQMEGFGEYGFPESHSASFALLAYVSAWLKHYEPAAFLAALLNSQPLGFYSPWQLTQDAQRHGVTVLPVDVTASDWESRDETGIVGRPTVRLGLHMVRGLSQASGERIAAFRGGDGGAGDPPAALDTFARQAAMGSADLRLLAEAGALATLAGHRRNAHWLAAGVEARTPLLENTPVHETLPLLPTPSEGETIVADRASTGLVLGRHPLALLRPRMRRMQCVSASELAALPHGSRTRAAGIVTCRQRPGTASGVVFVTLEDETGCVNVVVWNRLVERQRRELLGARLMAVDGEVQKEGTVVHLVAKRLIDHTALLGRLTTASRDFH
jgi:error-prone DNA polymerase